MDAISLVNLLHKRASGSLFLDGDQPGSTGTWQAIKQTKQAATNKFNLLKLPPKTHRGNVSKQKMSILMMITSTDMIATYRAAVDDSGCSKSSQICRCQYLVGSGLAVSSWPKPELWGLSN